ncbi:hypothetical protein [Sulfitobacter dubius]|uniref:hypothetical protein n=1 Tax=Sulfitobacter dubius TaxID=218673 RepID=UPI0029425B5A|nr:hypothetical protein [Sulfitobacter dubius]WOI31075.1 hypothetical protein R1T39_16815 [Sulfitobacter dubius]
MYITNPTHMLTGNAFRPSFKCPPLKGRFQLTRADRIGVERLLSLGLTSECPNPALIEGFLHHKLRLARPAPEPTPANLVVAGRLVSFMTNGGRARSGMLTFVPADGAGCIPVTSFLGATMLGMQKLQRAPLLREEGWIDTLIVLDVCGV